MTSLQRTARAFVFGGLMLTGVGASASAALLDGQQVTTTFFFPNLNTIGFGGVPVISTVGPGVEIASSPQGFPITSIDFSDTSIRLDFFQSLVGTVASFNGWQFSDTNGTIPDFSNATLVTNLPGWQVTFDANNIYLNGSGASYFVGSTLRMDITSAVTAVPEPASLTLLSAALIGFAAIRRRRQV